MKRRYWTSKQKSQIVLEGLSGKIDITQLCQKYQVSQTQYYKWRDQFFEGAKQGLSDQANGSPEKAKIKELERLVGQQTVTISMLKKIQNLPDD